MKEYDEYHKAVWPEVVESIRGSGILQMEIYRLYTRLFMIMETDDAFSFEEKARLDAGNAKVQEWENLMWRYQSGLPWSKPGEKWMLMDRIFDLASCH